MNKKVEICETCKQEIPRKVENLGSCTDCRRKDLTLQESPECRKCIREADQYKPYPYFKP